MVGAYAALHCTYLPDGLRAASLAKVFRPLRRRKGPWALWIGAVSIHIHLELVLDPEMIMVTRQSRERQSLAMPHHQFRVLRKRHDAPHFLIVYIDGGEQHNHICLRWCAAALVDIMCECGRQSFEPRGVVAR